MVIPSYLHSAASASSHSTYSSHLLSLSLSDSLFFVFSWMLELLFTSDHAHNFCLHHDSISCAFIKFLLLQLILSLVTVLKS